jgi:putative protease
MQPRLSPSRAELMAPAGSYESLMAAIHAGAHAIYFGIEHLNMRARSAHPFTLSDLKKIASICKKHGVKSYLTLNTIIYNKDINLAKKICDHAKKSGISAIIAMDMAVICYARKIDLEVHMSTQTNISNIEAVKFYARYADVIVLAREVTVDAIKEICSQIQKEKITGPNKKLVGIEVFVHGALCVSISGKCYMSLAQYQHSANCGDCLQACRRAYRVIDEETGDELVIQNKYVMSPKDLCTIGSLHKLLDAGVTVLKIEGRGRSPDYVHTVTKTYREAIDAYYAKSITPEKVQQWITTLETVYNRGFWHGGYYLGEKTESWSGVYGSKATTEKQYVGLVQNYYQQKGIAAILLESGIMKRGDELLITGPTTGVLMVIAEHLLINNHAAEIAKKGELITIPVTSKVRKNDKVYVLKKRLSF